MTLPSFSINTCISQTTSDYEKMLYITYFEERYLFMNFNDQCFLKYLSSKTISLNNKDRGSTQKNDSEVTAVMRTDPMVWMVITDLCFTVLNLDHLHLKWRKIVKCNKIGRELD